MSIKRCCSIVLVAVGSLVTACGGLVGLDEASGGASTGRGEATGNGAGDGAAAGPSGETQWTRSVVDVDQWFAIQSLTAVPGGGAAFTGAISPNGGRPVIERIDDSGARVWRRTVESGSIEPYSIVADERGVTVAGSYGGAVDFGGAALSDWGSFAARLDGTGATRWVWADPQRELGIDIVADGDGGVLFTRYKVPASKLDANGQLVWSRGWDGAPEVVSLTRGTSGAYALSGFRGSSSVVPLDLGAGPIPKPDTDTDFLAFYGPDGTYRWDLRVDVRYSPSIDGWEGISRVAVDAQDNVWIGGMVSSSISLGDQVFVSAGGADVFLAKLDSSGHVIFARIFGGGGDERLEDLAVDSTGRVVITGSFEDGLSLDGITLKRSGPDPSSYKSTLFVAKLEVTGQVAWARSSLDDQDSESGNLLAVDPTTNAIWLAGVRRFGESMKSRWFLAKLAP